MKPPSRITCGSTKYLPGTRGLLDRYGIQVVVMNAFEANSGSTYVLPLALADPAEKEWKMVFADAGAVDLHAPASARCPAAAVGAQIFASMEAQCQAIAGPRPGAAALRPQSGESVSQHARSGARAPLDGSVSGQPPGPESGRRCVLPAAFRWRTVSFVIEFKRPFPRRFNDKRYSRKAHVYAEARTQASTGRCQRPVSSPSS